MSTSTKVLIAVALVAAAILVQIFVLPYLGFGAGHEMSIMPTGRGFTYDFDSGAAFHSNDSRFFYFATRDAVRLMNSNDAAEWHHTLHFNNPWLSARGDYVAVGEERSGRQVYVFNDSGLSFRITMENPILSFGVNETGFLSVIAQYEGGYGIYVFNEHRTSTPLFHWDIFYDLVTPTHVEVSPDGRYVVITIVDLSFNVRSSVQFRYMNQWDAWNTDLGLFATQDFPGEIITALRFMDGNRLVVATTSRISGFQLGPGHAVSRELWTINLENAKTHIQFYGGTHFAFAVGDRLLTTMGDGDPVGTVRIYGVNGNPTGRFELGRRATHLRMGHSAVIVGGDRSFHAMDFRGTPLWEHTSLFDTRDVLFLDNTNTILIAGSNQAEIFERRRIREEYREFDFEFGIQEEVS
ncbi:MAG: DUF5711 family protein [Defluviitaleaceae bacterium]|nr:DUF5711 family protein [Defluviitaleaceae bacterium]MCL2261802.1 DUF5711 family protein [Defluviitaleaceae bacterium]